MSVQAKTERLEVRLTRDDLDALQAASATFGVPVSELVRAAILYATVTPSRASTVLADRFKLETAQPPPPPRKRRRK